MPSRSTTPPPARTPEEVIDALVPDGADYTHRDLIDAALTTAHAEAGRGDAWEDTDGTMSVLLGHRFFPVTEARRIIAHAFGPDGAPEVTMFLAVHRTAPLLECDDAFVVQVLILVANGFAFRPHGMGAYLLDMPFDKQVAWVGSWDAASLAACIDAGLTGPELEAILDSQTRPDLNQTRTLAALRPQEPGR